MGKRAISTYLREHAGDIINAWLERVQRDVPETRRLSRPALIDHLPEFLTAIADWIDGETERARRGFDRLAEGHALQRLGHGVTIDGLTDEYVLLREVLLTSLLAVDGNTDARHELVRLNTGMDLAISESVRRYANQRDQIRERFIGILGHDLRNPLSAIALGAGTLVRADDLPPRYLALGAKMLRSADRMQLMVEQVLAFAQGHLGGGIPAEPVPADMGELVAAAVEECTTAYPDRQIRLVVEGDLRGAWDPARVSQAFSNLIGNAIHHGQDPITVTVREESATQVYTEVANGGDPIPEDALATLFDPFRRSRGAGRKHGAGLGLGLYIVDQIALAHGATIDVTSTVGEGTRFELRWPRTLPGAPGASPDARGGAKR